MNIYEAMIKTAVKNRDKRYLCSQIAQTDNHTFWQYFDHIVLGEPLEDD